MKLKIILLLLQDVHFKLSSFIERIIKNHDNDDALHGNGYDTKDPFLDDSELQENLNHEKEREKMDDLFYADKVNKTNNNDSKSKGKKQSSKALENISENLKREILEREFGESDEEISDDDDDETKSINILKPDIENELNSLEQYINYFHIDLSNDMIDEKINSIDILILEYYNQKRPKIYINRLCSILKASKKEIKKKLYKIERNNKMKEIERMKENEKKELIKKMVKEYENQSIIYIYIY